MVALIILFALPLLQFGLLDLASLGVLGNDVITLADGTQTRVRQGGGSNGGWAGGGDGGASCDGGGGC